MELARLGAHQFCLVELASLLRGSPVSASWVLGLQAAAVLAQLLHMFWGLELESLQL